MRELNEKKQLKKITRLFKGMWQTRIIKGLYYDPKREVVTVYFKDFADPYKISVAGLNDVGFVEKVVGTVCMLSY